MEILYLLIPISVILVFVIGVAFWWSVRSGQYDDLEGPGYRVLMDDDGVGDKPANLPGDDRSEPPKAD
jgi:cbb3-type cytochrome oxidase maturation protein